MPSTFVAPTTETFGQETLIDALIGARLPGWMRNDATISVTQTTPANAATNVYTTRVSVSSAKATPLTFFTRAAPFTLQTEVEMKQELPFM